MKQPECDIWFGPGGLKGVFGAGLFVTYGGLEKIVVDTNEVTYVRRAE